MEVTLKKPVLDWLLVFIGVEQMAVEAQVKVTGDFSKIISDFRKLLPMVDVTKGSFAELGKVISRMDMNAIASGGKRALNAVHKAMFDAAKLARGTTPMGGSEFQQRLLGLDKLFETTGQPEIAHQLKTMLREAQQQAITNSLKSTATGINDSLRQLTDSLSVDATKYTNLVDKDGKRFSMTIGDDAKKVLQKLNTAITNAAKSSLELIDISSIEDWGKRTLGKDWSTRGATGVKGVSAQTLVRDSLKKANEQIVKNIQDGITKNVEDAIASGKKLSDTYVKDIESQISKLRGQIVSAGGSEAYIKSQLAKLGEFSDTIKTKLKDYSTNLVNADEIKRLEQRARELLESIQRKGSVTGKGYDLSNLFREAATHADKLSNTFDDLRKTVEQTFRRQVDSIFSSGLAKGVIDKSAFQALYRDAENAGVDRGVLIDAAKRIGALSKQLNENIRKETEDKFAQQLRDKADELGKLKAQIDAALQQARLDARAGSYTSKSLQSLVERYKEQGGRTNEIIREMERINTQALEERLRKTLASEAKIQEGAVRGFKIEAERFGANQHNNTIRELFNQITQRRQQELNDVLASFNEQYADALFRIRQQFLSGQQVNFEGFRAKWSRRAAEIGSAFDSNGFNREIQRLYNEKASRDLAIAAEGIRKQQNKLLADVDTALRKSSREGTSVANVGELTHRLTAEIMSGQGNWAALTDAAVRLRDRVEQDFIKEIRALKDAALNAQKAISQDKITSLTNRIRASGDLFDAGEINGLLTQLSNAVVDVDTTLRNNTIAALRKSIRDTSTNLQLSAKQLRAELDKFTAEAKGLGVSGDRNVVNEIATLHRLTVNRDLRELLKSTSIDAQVIGSLRQEFASAGGASFGFTSTAITGIRNQLVATTTELKANGKKFEDGLVTFYEALFRETGASSTTLASLSTFIKSQQTSVNTEYRSRLEAAVRKQLADANRLKQVVSEYTLRTLEQNWLKETGGTDFRSVFSAELGEQEQRRALNALKQRLEGIWKPYLERLRELSSMKTYDPSGYSAKLLSVPKEQMEAEYRKAVRSIVHSGTTGLADRGEVTAALNSFQTFRKQLFADWDKAFVDDVRKRVDAYRTQLSDAILANNKAMLPKVDDLRNLQRQSIGTVAQGDAARMMQDYTKAQRHFLEQSAKEFQTRLKQMTAQINRGVRGALSRGEFNAVIKEGNELERQLRETGSAMTGMFKQIRTNLVRASNEARRQAASMRGSGQGGKGEINGIPEGIYRNYLRQLPMQITDIVVGLSTGQRPMYVLLQQGGQLKDMFGGIGNAVKEVGKYILGLLTPMNLAIAAVGGLTAVMGGLVKRASNINSEMLKTNVILSGAAGRTFDFETVRRYGKELSDMYAIMESRGRKAVMSIAQNARVPEQVIKPMLENLRDLQAYLGKGFDASGLEDTIETLTRAFSINPNGGLMNLREFLSDIKDWTEEEGKQVETLYAKALATKNYNEKAEAMARIMDIVKEKSKGAAEQGLTEFEKATESMKRELINAWSVLADASVWNTLREHIEGASEWFASFAQDAAKKISSIWSAIKEVGAGLGSKWDAFKETSLGKVVTGTIGQIYYAPSIHKPELFNYYNARTSEGLSELWQPLKNTFTGKGSNIGEFTVAQYGKMRRSAEELRPALRELELQANKTAPALKKAAGGYILNLPQGTGETRRGGGSRGAQTDKDLENAQRYVQQLKEQYDQVSKMSVAQKLEYDLTEGKVKMQGELLDRAREYARVIDERALKEAEATRQMQLQVLQEEKRIALENRYREMQYEVAKLMGSDRSADYFKGLIDFDIELERNAKKIRRERDKAIRDAEIALKPQAYIDGLKKYYDDWLDEERKFTADSIELYKQRQKELDELSRQWTVGYKDGLEEVADWLFSISSEVSSAVQNWAGGLADALATAARTGKLSFKDLANSILDDIARIASRQFVSALFGGFQYGWTATPQSSQSKTAESLMSKSVPQNVFVVNKGFGSFTKAAESLGGITEAVKGGFTLGGGSNTDLGPDPWGLAGTSDKVVLRIGSEVSPAIREGANSMFSGLFDKIGSIFSGIGSSISNLFNGIKLPSFSFGGGGGGFFSSLFSGIGNFFSSLFGLFASGGYTGSGGKYTPAGIVHKGEFVINAASTRKLGLDFLNRLNGYADGGYVTPTPSIVHSNMSKDMNNGLEVNIYNQTDSKITAQRNSSGGLDIFVEQAVNAVAGNIMAGGAVASAIQRAYALNRGVGTQRTGY